MIGLARATALATVFALATAASASAQPVREGAPRDTAAAAAPDPIDVDRWLGRDKRLHAGASFALTLGGQLALTEGSGLAADRALPLAAGTALALGVMKELTDRRRARNPVFSWRDLVADAVGVAAAAALVASL